MTVKRAAATDIFSAKCLLLGPRLMKDLGLTENQAAGLLGNLGHESAGFRLLQEVKPRAGRGGWGLAQWTGPRRVAMEKWCAAHHFDKASDEGNYQYLCVELRGSEAGALKALKQQHTLEGATHSFCDHFERPGVKAYISRVGYARKALAAIQKGLAAQKAAAAQTAAAPVATPPTPTASPAKPKPVADKHAVAEKPAPKPVAKKPVPVRKRAAPVAHHTAHAKAKRH